ncbi:hypothetical protein [Anaerotignum sp.]|uniref:hypothetical protein n=1 Tax=Anaerotignum sp. TaxID=2039241 RepID=UPI00332FC7A0
MNFAMVIENNVIDVVKNVDKAPDYPPDMIGRPVIALECDETVKIGMIYNNGEFIEPEPTPPKPYQPTEGELLLMKSQAAVYEEMQANRLSQMKANADIYEAILSNGGAV